MATVQQQQQTYAAWTQEGAVGFFIANDHIDQRIVIARVETAIPNSAVASVLGGFLGIAAAPSSAASSSDGRSGSRSQRRGLLAAG